MSADPHLIRSPRLFSASVLLCLSCLLAPACVSTPDQTTPNRNATPWKASSLGIPDKNAPWQLMAQVNGTYVNLRVPRELPLLKNYPDDLQQALKTRIDIRNSNIDILAHLAEGVQEVLGQERLQYVPQYDRSMDEIVISMDPEDVVDGNPLFKHEPILRNLPAYTMVHLFVPEPYVDAAQARLGALRVPNRVNIYPVQVWASEKAGIQMTHTSVAWTQDLFWLSVNSEGEEYLFIPAAYLNAEDLSTPDTEYLQYLAETKKRRKIVRVPIFYHAGNLLAGETDDPVLFIGKGALKLNERLYFNATQARSSDESMVELLKTISGTGKAVILPNSNHLFHIDMAMAILDKGVAAVIDPLDTERLDPADRDVLKAIRSELTARGFKVILIPTVTARIEAFQSPVNVVKYVNRVDKKRYVYVPEYPDVQVTIEGRKRSLNQAIAERFAQGGMTVIPIEDRFSFKKGDIHCVLKVLD